MRSGLWQRVWMGVIVLLAVAVGWSTEAAAQGKKAKSAGKAAAKRPANDQVPDLSPEDVTKIETAIPTKAAATPKQPRRVLVFWRCEGFFHGQGIAGGNQAIESMGKATGAYTADISRDYEVFTPANLAKYDAVVLNNTTGLKLSAEQQQALLDFVNSGKGLVGVHAATDNFYDWPEGASMLGGLFSGHPWGGGGTWAFKIDEPDHTLTRAFGGKGFKLRDEIYQFKDPYTRNDRRVLLSLDLSDKDTGDVAESKGGRAGQGLRRGLDQERRQGARLLLLAGPRPERVPGRRREPVLSRRHPVRPRRSAGRRHAEEVMMDSSSRTATSLTRG